MAPECPKDLYLCQEGKEEAVLGARSEDVKRVNEDQVTRQKGEGRYGEEGRGESTTKQAETQRDIGRGRGTISGNPPSRRRHKARRARPITLMKTGSFSQGRGGNVPWCVSREPP